MLHKEKTEERELFWAPNMEWVSMLSAGRRYNFQGIPFSFLSCREVAAVVPTQKIYLEAVSLAYPYLLTWMQPSCILAEGDAVGQVKMPCAWPSGPPQSHTCLPCSTVTLLTWIIRKWILHLFICCRIKPSYMCINSSFNPHLPAEHHFKHMDGSRSNPPASCV